MTLDAPFVVHPLHGPDGPWVCRLLTAHWGSPRIVTRGRVHQGDQLPGFAATSGEEPVGLATYRIDGTDCELVSLNSLRARMGIGTALLEAVVAVARTAGLGRVWLVTTNDNLPALRFYQRRGWRLCALYPGAIDHSRRLKPEIRAIGLDGIPLRDEIELELRW